jgi:hypothetical protein
LAYIQPVLKCRHGIGESFIIDFSADKDFDSQFLNFNEDDDNENTFDKVFYCETLLKKIGFYLEKFLNIKVLSMKGEFIKDENGKI